MINCDFKVHNEKEILAQIKKAILAIVPDAQVYLFGSRARGDWHDESDWDILVLTQETVNRSLKHRIYEKVFPISLQIGDFINYIVVNENDWNEKPSYYVLHTSIKPDMISV